MVTFFFSKPQISATKNDYLSPITYWVSPLSPFFSCLTFLGEPDPTELCIPRPTWKLVDQAPPARERAVDINTFKGINHD